MDNIDGHPIPQDITGFQFRLIGDMTVKQFAYLAGGIVIAWFFFSLPIFIFIKLPVAGVFALFGAMLAFVPIHGRPADTMIMLFFKAIFKPNQFSYKTPQSEINHADKIDQPQAQANQNSSTAVVPILTTQKTPTELNKPEVTNLENQKIADIKMSESSNTSVATEVIQVPSEKLTSSVLTPAPPISQPQPISITPQTPQSLPGTAASVPIPSLQAIPHVNNPYTASVIQTKPLPTVPLVPSDAPNLIYGVIKDPRENILPNILVEVKDPDNNPVRAFKTNQLGQFASATPLPNGIYTVSFDDPKKAQKFTRIELSAAGQPLPPLIVVSSDEREALRKKLFPA